MQKTLSKINLSAIRKNALKVRSMIGGRFFFAVVKADAYGHGAEEVAAELEDVCDGFCVAIADEGAALRISGIRKPILVFAPPVDKSDAIKLARYKLTATAADINSAKLIAGAPCHVAVNTGMNRYGSFGKDLDKMLTILPSGSIKGVYTHLYAADNGAECAKQLALFNEAEAKVKAVNSSAIAHISASGGILRGGEFLKEGVRCGIMLYGYSPSGFYCKLSPALKVYAVRTQRVKCTGGGVGYSLATKKYTRLATYRLGYADGFKRGAPLGEGKLCMDAFISLKNGKLLPVMTDAESYARECGTITYEVLCSVTKRSLKIYER